MLPEGYRQLEYIENAEIGSYIDTGIIPSADMKVEVDGYVIDGDTAFFGSRRAVQSNDAFTLQFTSEKFYRFNFNSSRTAAPKSYVTGVRHNFAVSVYGFFIDDTEISKEGNDGILLLGGFDGQNYVDTSLVFNPREMKIRDCDIVIPNMSKHFQFLFHKESAFIEFDNGSQLIFDMKNNVHLLTSDSYELFSEAQ